MRERERKGEREKGRKGEREKGRKGEREKGRKGEGEREREIKMCIWVQCYKTFFLPLFMNVRNKLEHLSLKYLLRCLKFASKTEAYPSEAAFRCSLQWWSFALPYKY